MNDNSLFFKTITSQSKTLIIINNDKICYSYGEDDYRETILEVQSLEDFLFSFLDMKGISVFSHQLSKDSAVVIVGESDHSEKECELFYKMMHRINLILSNRVISLLIGYKFEPDELLIKKLNANVYPELELDERHGYVNSTSLHNREKTTLLRSSKSSWFSIRTVLATVIVFGIVLSAVEADAIRAFFCISTVEEKYKNFEFEDAESCNNIILNKYLDDNVANKWKSIILDAKEHVPLLHPAQVPNEKINDVADYLLTNRVYSVPTSEIMNDTISESGMKIYPIPDLVMTNVSNSIPYNNNTSLTLLVNAENTQDNKVNYYSLLNETMPLSYMDFDSTVVYIQTHGEKPRSSLVLYNIVYERDNKNSRALMGLANILLDLENLDLEKMYYKDELKLDVENVTKFDIVNGFYKLVEEIYKEKPPGNGVPNSLTGQATILLKNNEFDNAITKFEEGKELCEFEAEELKIDKHDASCVINPLNGMGLANLRNSNHAEAKKIFDDILERDKENIPAKKGLGFIHLFNEEYDESKEKFIEVLNKRPNIIYSLIDDANYFITENDKISEIDFLYDNILLEMMPNSLIVIDGKGSSLLQTNRTDEALSYYEEKFVVYPKVVDIILGYADALYQDKQYEEALEKYLLAQKLNPKNEMAIDGINKSQVE